MPELPEVETTKASLAPLLGQSVTAIEVYQPKLRWPMPADLYHLVGHRLSSVDRRAKYLILTFSRANAGDDANTIADSTTADSTRRLLVHLGMSGSLQQFPAGSQKQKHDHMIMQFVDSSGQITQLHYHDPRRFGAVLWHDEFEGKLLTHLGIEPLSDQFDGSYLYQLIHRHHPILADGSGKRSHRRPLTRAIKSVIMDQQIVVGVGNIYATESLYLAGIHPAQPAHSLTQSQLESLVSHIKTILAKAISLGGSTLRDFTVAGGQSGYFQQTLHVYGRQGDRCGRCDHILDNIKLNGRASVFCPQCQMLTD